MNSQSFSNSSPWPYLALHGWVSQTVGSDSITPWATIAVHQSQVSRLQEDHVKGQIRCTLSAASTLCTSLTQGLCLELARTELRRSQNKQAGFLIVGKCWQHCKHIALSPSKCTVNKVANAFSHTPWFSSKQWPPWEGLWAHRVTAGLYLNRSAALNIQIPRKHLTYN